MVKKYTFSDLWNNFTTSGMAELNINPFTQKSFVVRFINVFGLLFLISTILIVLRDIQQALSTHSSPHFLVDITAILAYFLIFYILRRTHNISIATSIFLVIFIFGILGYLLYAQPEIPGNIFYTFIIPYIIFVFKGTKSGKWWWLAFTGMVLTILQLRPNSLLTMPTTGTLSSFFLFMMTYLIVSGTIYAYQRLNERYTKLAEKNQNDLTKALAAQQELTQAKVMFINVVAHKLRTPLTIIRAQIEQLFTEFFGPLPEHIKAPIRTLQSASSRLINLVNDLLAVLQIDLGEVPNVVKQIDLVETISEVVEQKQEEAKQKLISLQFPPQDEKGADILIDKSHLKTIIGNLLTNAIDYNKKNGTVTISLERTPKDFLIHIKDTGMGISEKDQDKVFTKFYRAEEAVLKQTEGSGLGLFIVKAYVDAIGGKIHFKSPLTEKGGSEFIVELPIGTT